jgi:SAM-dependent methyltransferase
MRRLLPQGTAYFGCDGHWETPPYDDAPYEKWLFDSTSPILPFAGETFGAVACSGLIEYIEDQELLFRVIFERLAPGGYLFCSAINPLFPRYLMGRYRLPKGRWHPAWRKVRAWKAILSDLQRVGFALESYAYIPDKETSEAASKRALEAAHSLAAGIPNFLQFSHSQGLFIVRKPLAK